jgi:hypothetical protein
MTKVQMSLSLCVQHINLSEQRHAWQKEQFLQVI